MKWIVIIGAGLLFTSVIFLAQACTAKKKIFSYTADCGDKKISLEVYDQRQYSNSYHFLKLTYGNLPAIIINVGDITGNGLPYRQEMYDTVPHFKFDTIVRYTTVPNENPAYAGNTSRYPYLLYIDPAVCKKEDFGALGKCLQQQVKPMEKVLYDSFINPQHHLNYPQLMGIIYARREDFVEKYEYDGKKYIINPDGCTMLKRNNEEHTDNSLQVGQVKKQTDTLELIVDEYNKPPQDYTLFKNTKTGRALTQDFKINIIEKFVLNADQYKRSIMSQDLSTLWLRPTVAYIDSDGEEIPINEPLGYIGKNFQRFYIHFINIKKDTADPYLYYAAGKTRVENNTKSFTGTIRVLPDSIGLDPIINDTFQNGHIVCEIKLYEEKGKLSSGSYEGRLQTWWYLDRDKSIKRSDYIEFPDLRNNLTSAIFRAYDGSIAQPCAWGENDIPGSDELVVQGDNPFDFTIQNKYIKYGWQNYDLAYGRGGRVDNEEKIKKAIAEENREWWK